jgi:hypothetical protein
MKTRIFSTEEHASASRSPAGKRAFFNPAIQPKLTVGEPNDRYELEADAVADAVAARGQTAAPALQTKRDGRGAEEHASIQRQEFDEKEEEESVQAKAAAGGLTVTHSDATQSLESRLHDSAGGGTELPQQTQMQMSSAFGADFSAVRLHTDQNSLQMNQALNARAFTHGRDIYLGQSAFDPQSRSDSHLLAHELTHVVQQGAAEPQASSGTVGDGQIQRLPNVPDLQMLQVSYPAAGGGHVQHRSHINNTYYVDWDAFIEDDVLLFKFEYVGSDNASIHVSLFDTEGNGYLGGGIVTWGPDDSDVQYIEFSDFPPRAGGGVRTSVTTRTELINDTEERRGISAWKWIYRG